MVEILAQSERTDPASGLPGKTDRALAVTLYTLWPQEQRAMQLLGLGPDLANVHQPVEEFLFGGPAGGGKSLLLCAIGVTQCTIWPRAVVPLLRRAYPELEETQSRAILSEIPRTIACYTGDRRELRFPNGP
jgi:hypothetical protein